MIHVYQDGMKLKGTHQNLVYVDINIPYMGQKLTYYRVIKKVSVHLITTQKVKVIFSVPHHPPDIY
jgi:hypothetical protein